MRGVYIGRFQPFHKGHKQVVERYRKEFDEFLIAVGSADKSREERNPLTPEERKEIIKNCFPDIEVIEIEDIEEGEDPDRDWAKEIEGKSLADAALSQNDLVKELINKHTDLDLIEHDLFDPEIYSGTEVRRRIRSGEEWRYLVPKCCTEAVAEKVEEIKESGIQYEFKPGWKKENAFHGTQ